MTWRLVIPGQPVPEARARRAPNHRGVYTPKAQRDFRARVIFAAARALLLPTPSGLLSVTYRFYTVDRRACDLDNLEKGTQDAMTACGRAWKNDQLIWEKHTSRFVSGDNPRIEVEWEALEVLDESPPLKRQRASGPSPAKALRFKPWKL